MWKRKDIKRRAKTALKGNYLAAVGVCFIMMMFFGRYAVSKEAIISYNPADEIQEPVVEQGGYLTSDMSVLQNVISDISHQLDKKRETDPTYATEGVLSSVLNDITQSSGPLFKMIGSIKSFIQNRISTGVYMLISLLLTVLIYLFVRSIVRLGEKRFFMESRLYRDTQIRRILYLYKEKQILNPAKILLLRGLRLSLWALTLVMYPVKYYEYSMVPYIVAENPKVSAKDAFSLSKQLTQGNKWKLFVMDLSYWYWDILNLLTFGLLGIFFLNPYRTAAETEIYLTLRHQAMQRQGAPIPVFCCDALTVRPDPPVEGVPDLYPGLWEEIKQKEKKDGRFLLLDYDRSYQLSSYILLFFSFSMLGWLWEVGIHLVEDGQFVNRGVLFGPWLPIYGSGGVIIVFLLRKMGKWPVATFLSSMTLCSIVEYFTSWMLEITKGAKWWDYSGYLFNLNGRICLEGALVFGMGGCLFIYFLAPGLDELFKKLSARTRWTLCIGLLALFLCDLGYSHFHPNMGEGITDYARSFWQQLCVKKEDIEEVRYCYQGQEITLGKIATERTLDCLSLSEPTEVEENHEFIPSSIGVTFIANGKEYPVTFYWFPYVAASVGNFSGCTSELLPSSPPSIIGDRFDVMIDGKKYHYRFTTDQVLTEENMLSVYDQLASENHLLTRAEMDGGSFAYQQGGLFTTETYTADEILSQSQLILLATYKGERWNIDPEIVVAPSRGFSDIFYIDEVLKGEAEDLTYAVPSGSVGKYVGNIRTGKTQVAYPAVYAPPLQIGKQYLICVGKNSYGAPEYFGQYGRAVLDGNTLFPIFNTEEHPFYNVSLQDVRDLISVQE